jgi:Tol biopolymer transport system component
MSDVVKTAICYRADKSLKWATWLPDGTTLPPTTIEEGETLWPCVYYGQEKDGRPFFVPLGGPIEGPTVTA